MNPPAASDDEQLIRSAQSGNHEAFCRVVSRYGKSVYMLARFYCRSAADAEDLSQEVWMRVWKARADFRWEASFSTWLRQIVVHTFLNCRRSSSLERAATQVQPQYAVDALEFADLGGADKILANVLAGQVREALVELSGQQRLMFMLKHQEGLTYQEIGTAFGCSTGTVKKAVFRAMQLLRTRLEPGKAMQRRTDD
jgi:RNA polymerase sigma-70 factor (ECF subfamily)